MDSTLRPPLLCKSADGCAVLRAVVGGEATAAACFSNMEAFCRTDARVRSSCSTMVGESVSIVFVEALLLFVLEQLVLLKSGLVSSNRACVVGDELLPKDSVIFRFSFVGSVADCGGVGEQTL